MTYTKSFSLRFPGASGSDYRIAKINYQLFSVGQLCRIYGCGPSPAVMAQKESMPATAVHTPFSLRRIVREAGMVRPPFGGTQRPGRHGFMTFRSRTWIICPDPRRGPACPTGRPWPGSSRRNPWSRRSICRTCPGSFHRNPGSRCPRWA